MDLPITDDGLYVFNYPNNAPHTYTSVEYISQPIINYSTYTSSDSTGKQMIYIYQPHINDTLSVMGCIQGDYCKEVSFIVTE